MKSNLSRRAFVGGLISSTACGRSLKHFPFDHSDPPSEGVEITYFSVGCMRIRFQGRTLLTDPFFSHIPFSRVAFGKTISDPKQYTPYLKEVRDVDAVLVGHSHYDHVLDLSAIAPHLAPNAQIFGSQTLNHTYAASKLPRPIVPVNEMLATEKENGTWIPIPEQNMRILPIRSNHPTQYLFLHLFTEKLNEDRRTPPIRASDYQEGITIAYLVDFLHPQTQEVQCRVYIQTSSTGYPAGYFPPSILEEKSVDVAVLAMDCANIKAAGTEQSIIDFLSPSSIVFCHWEDFFRTKDKEPKEIVRVNLAKLKESLPSTPNRRYVFPYWDRSYIFSVSSK
jgi:L-ascorbate metabolism protein UlaG (beta-lactamase superfamily)